jgi:hypothetical protein
MNNGKTIYIAGPMSKIEECNFPTFDMAEADLRAKGWNVINPAQMDRDIGFDPLIDTVDEAFLHGAMLRDVDAIARRADALAVLPGWRQSTGAKAEVGLARWKHIPVYSWPDMVEIPRDEQVESSGKDPITSHKEEVNQSPTLSDAEDRKRTPIASGVLDYFPKAIAALARCSYVGNEQHNAGQPLHWAREKSSDHADCLIRHFMERGIVDTDGVRHSTKCAWRSLALLELELEAAEA